MRDESHILYIYILFLLPKNGNPSRIHADSWDFCDVFVPVLCSINGAFPPIKSYNGSRECRYVGAGEAPGLAPRNRNRTFYNQIAIFHSTSEAPIK